MSVRATSWAWEKGRALKLSQGELLLLVRIADHADNDGICWPGSRHLAEYVCPGAQDDSTVRRNMKRLEGRDLMHRERQPAKSGRGRENDRIFLHLPPVKDQPGESPGRSAAGPTPPSGSGIEEGQRDLPGDLPGRSADAVQPGISERSTGHPTPVQPGKSPSPYIDEPSGTVTEPIHTQRARIDLPDGVLEAVAEVAALKRHPTPPPEQLAKITADFPDRDIPVEAERFRRYYLAGKGRARSMGDPAEAWRRWLAGADPIPTPRHLRPVPEARAFDEAAAAAGREKWAAALVDLRPQIAAAAFEARIEPIEPLGFEDGTLFVRAPEEARSWLERRYSSLIEATTDCKLELAA